MDASVAIPESYRALLEFAVKYRAGETVYEQGSVPDRVLLVLSGLVNFEAVSPSGERSLVHQAVPGEPIGHLEAFAARPTETAAVAVEDSALIAIPIGRVTDAFRAAPDLALQLITEFVAMIEGGATDTDATAPDEATLAAAAQQPAKTEADAPDETATSDKAVAPAEAAEPAEPAEATSPPEAAAPQASDENMQDDAHRPIGDYDETAFFVDKATCPVSGTRFSYIRVRTSAVRPVSRDTDFYVTYRTVDPTHYSIVVCPGCGFAAYHDDFEQLEGEEARAALVEAQAERDGLDREALSGERTLDDAVTALELALLCYGHRGAKARRMAVLQHRRAWLERARGNEAEELGYIQQARDLYRESYETDSSISEESAMRAAYLIGILTLRGGDPLAAGRWFETALRYPEAKKQTGLARMAREAQQDAREAVDKAAEKMPRSA